MSNKNRNRNRHRRGNKKRNYTQGKRVIKTFDPTQLASKTSVEQAKPKEYKATHSFSDFKLNPKLSANIAKKGYKNPTPIQDQTILPILNGKDLIGLAGTGTGKTGAFLIPLVNKYLENPNTKVLVLAPTRELAIQIQTELNELSSGTNLKSAICIGGVPIKRQISSLYQRPSFVIGTPGRLLDLSNRKNINFANFNCIVLDEVDRMLDMGFVHDIKKIVAQLPYKRHSLFFSATLPNSLMPIVKQFLKDPVRVQVESQKTSANVEQKIVNVNGQNKTEILHDLLITDGFDKVLVFGRTKHGLNRLGKELTSRGFKTTVIHGNKSQNQRQKALESFKNNDTKIMLATDIAARGLDIDNVSHVINYDLPTSEEEYIHRIGRTGRADKSGVAISFVG
jgi:superfamily II DNA/RNA helicase